MFGDHLPPIGEGFSTFTKTGIKGIDFYKTPYIIWANYDIDYEKIDKNLSPSALSIKLLDITNINAPWYLKPFKELYTKYPGINNKLILDNKGKIIDDINSEDEILLNDAEILQYQMLIKEKGKINE